MDVDDSQPILWRTWGSYYRVDLLLAPIVRDSTKHVPSITKLTQLSKVPTLGIEYWYLQVGNPKLFYTFSNAENWNLRLHFLVLHDNRIIFLFCCPLTSVDLA